MAISVSHTKFTEILGVSRQSDDASIRFADMYVASLDEKNAEIAKKAFLDGLQAQSRGHDVFNSNEIRSIEVPDFQREYVWEKGKEISEFWGDIKDVYDVLSDADTLEEVNELVDGNTGLFLGNVIFLKEKDKYQIIDGQQRFTTLFILLIAFRTFLHNKLNFDVLTEKEKIKTKELIRFCNSCFYRNDENNPFFVGAPNIQPVLVKLFEPDWFDSEISSNPNQDLTQIDVPKELNIEMIDAKNKTLRKEKFIKKWKKDALNVMSIFSYFHGKLMEDITEPSKFHFIREIYRNIQFVQVTVAREEDAYVFFERTNSRGATLEVFDLLKAYVFGNSSANHDVKQWVAKKWHKIIPNPVETTRNKTLVNYFYNRLGGNTQASKDNEVFKKLKEFYPTHHLQKEDSIKNLMNELEEFGEFFDILHGRKLSRDSLKKYIIRLHENSPYKDKINVFVDSQQRDHRIKKLCRSIQALSHFGYIIHIPLTHSILKTFFQFGFQTQKSLVDILNNFFSNLETVHFRFWIRGSNPAKYASLYHNTAKEFSNISRKITKLEHAKNIVQRYKYNEAEKLRSGNQNFTFSGTKYDIRMQESEAEYIITKTSIPDEVMVTSDIDVDEAKKIYSEFTKNFAISNYKDFSDAYCFMVYKDLEIQRTQFFYRTNTSPISYKYENDKDIARAQSTLDKFSEYEVIPNDSVFYYKNREVKISQFKKIRESFDNLIDYLRDNAKNKDDSDENYFHYRALRDYKDFCEASAALKKEKTFVFYEASPKRVSISYTEARSFLRENKHIKFVPHSSKFYYRGEFFDTLSRQYKNKNNKELEADCEKLVSKHNPDPEKQFKEFVSSFYKKQKANKAFPSEYEDFELSFIDKKLNSGNKLDFRYIFDKLNNLKMEEDGELVEISESLRLDIFEPEKDTKTSFTLDHFYPQAIEPQPDWLHNIGNIVLLIDDDNNKENGNLPHVKCHSLSKAQIKQLYETQKLVDDLTNEFAIGQKWDWDEERVNERAKNLSKMAFQIAWRYDTQI